MKLVQLNTCILIVVLLLGINLFAQHQEKSTLLVQLSGVVVDEGDASQIPFTTVYDRNKKHGVVSDYYGYFSLVVSPGDTLIFSSFTFQTNAYVVPDTLTGNRYTILHLMQKDTVELPEVVVYPWPSREDFARAFVEMEPYDDALKRAQRELSGESLAFVAARLDNDASLAFGALANQRYTKLYNLNQLPANNLLNPAAWSKLIQDWKAGKLSKQ